MKVVLSIDPVKFPLTGIGRYTFELACGLQAAHLDDLQFLRGIHLQSTIPLPDDSRPMDRTPAWKRFLQKNRLAVAAYRVLDPRLKGLALKGLEDHVFHGPNFYLPPFAGRSVATIHDLSPYLWSQSHPPERVRYMQAEIELSLQRASALITDTEYTRQEVAKFFSWPLEKIFAVPLASAPEFKPLPFEILRSALAPLGLVPDGYTLFTGIVLAVVGLLVTVPLILILFVVGTIDTGSPLFMQRRVGRYQRGFTLIKFRTMKVETQSVASHLANPSDVTPIGAFMRRTKLDELPQLWNVLKGDMSLVGPRPCLFNQTELINERAIRGVFDVRPGITGLAQTQGKAGAASDKDHIE